MGRHGESDLLNRLVELEAFTQNHKISFKSKVNFDFKS